MDDLPGSLDGMQGVRGSILSAPPGTTHRHVTSSGPLARDLPRVSLSETPQVTRAGKSQPFGRQKLIAQEGQWLVVD
jgi:hypothetical protein